MNTLNLDFETYSEAGLAFDLTKHSWKSALDGSSKRGLPLVGAWAYAQHPSTEALMCYYGRPGEPRKGWTPNDPPPQGLLDHVTNGGTIQAQNSMFEYVIWNYVCVRRYGWPELPIEQTLDTAALCRAHAIPSSLADSTAALGVTQKLGTGKNLIKKYSMPANLTKTRRVPRLYLHDHPEDDAAMHAYCDGDVLSEQEVAAAIPAFSEYEHAVWQLSEKINARGVHVDMDSAAALERLVDNTFLMYTAELSELTYGQVVSGSQAAAMCRFAEANGYPLSSVKEEIVTEVLSRDDVPANVRRMLEIRQLLGMASVKKLKSMRVMLANDGRLHDLFSYCGATRTGRFAGRGPQPQNLTSGGVSLRRCDVANGCGRRYGLTLEACPWCGTPADFSDDAVAWDDDGFLDVVDAARAHGGDVEAFSAVIGDPLLSVSGCLRGLFSAAPGKDFICSDFSAIEAVVAAFMAGEQWRMDVFCTHGKIYEMGASKLTGVPFEEFIEHKKRTGEHHPHRKKIGKVSELASTYGGSVGAWKQFGADKFMTDAEIKAAVKTWRKESPAIEAFWYGAEAAAMAAVNSPGSWQPYKSVAYTVLDDILYCYLPSGRWLAYHKPRIVPVTKPWGTSDGLTFMNATNKGWLRTDTYGGRLFENICQAVARDILVNSLLNLEAAGYPIVLHVHDEACAEVPEGFGSVEEFERIMGVMPAWAEGWPVRAAGGWRGKRFKK